VTPMALSSNVPARKRDRYIFLTREWAGHQWDATPEAAVEFVDGFVKEVGPDRAKHNIPKIYDFLDAQPWSWNSRKFAQLKRYRQKMKNDPSWRPTLALWSKRKSDALIAKILKLMRADPDRPWWPWQLAQRLREPRHRIRYLTRMMCDGDPPQLVRLAPRGPLMLPMPGLETRKPSSWRAIEMLIATGDNGLRFVDLKAELGHRVISALRTLRRNGVATPSDPRRKARIKLTPKAWSAIAERQPIRNHSRVILWAPTEMTTPPPAETSDVGRAGRKLKWINNEGVSRDARIFFDVVKAAREPGGPVKAAIERAYNQIPPSQKISSFGRPLHMRTLTNRYFDLERALTGSSGQ
jgi:hypothetical protein